MSEDRTSVLGFAVPVAGTVLTEGAQTRWTVHETLRKVYQVTV